MANRSTHEWHCSPPSDQISSDTARKLTTDDDQLANEQMQNAIESSRSLGTPINYVLANSMESNERQSPQFTSVPGLHPSS